VGQHKLVRARGNREVSDVARVKDQGQISKLLAHLEGVDLLENTGGHAQGVGNAWRLTSRGEEIVSLSSDRGGCPSVFEEASQ
jgi:hypothetical protein